MCDSNPQVEVQLVLGGDPATVTEVSTHTGKDTGADGLAKGKGKAWPFSGTLLVTSLAEGSSEEPLTVIHLA